MSLYARQPHGTWLSSFCRGTVVACLLLTVASSAFAQRISVGIKAGVPLTDVVEANHGGISNLPFQAQTRRYTIGPVVDIGLPLGFGVEFGAMYKRSAPVRSSFDRVGWLFGTGVDFKLHVIHVTPGLRYTHYGQTEFWLPSTNAVDFLVGFTF